MAEMNPRTRQPKGFRSGPFAYHEEIEVEISTLTNMGQGLGRIDDWVVMVRFALPQERVRARIYRNDKNYSEADLLEVLRPSPDRVSPPCPVFGECGGCQYQNLRYEAQLQWKSRQLRELLLHMARLDIEPRAAIASPKQYGYRSKLTPHFQKPKEGGEVEIGFLKAGSRFSYVEIERCPLASESLNVALSDLRGQIQKKQNQTPFRKGATLLLREHLDGTATDPKAIVRERVGGIVFSFPAGEFFQNNPGILDQFADYVGRQAASAGAPYLVDAYCGSGFFCLTAAQRFDQAVGVEVSELSVEHARGNAASNSVANARFVLGDAASIFGEIDFPGADAAVVIDPPRKGSSEAFLRQLIAFAPRTIVYVSCNPATQIRDLQPLLENGYRVLEVQPLDLFPQTKHLECVITIGRES